MAELKKVSSLFDRYKKTLIAPEASVINAFVEVVDDLLGISFPKNKIKYNPATKILTFSGSGLLRGECKLHEPEIIAHLRGRLGDKSAPKALQ